MLGKQKAPQYSLYIYMQYHIHIHCFFVPWLGPCIGHRGLSPTELTKQNSMSQGNTHNAGDEALTGMAGAASASSNDSGSSAIVSRISW